MSAFVHFARLVPGLGLLANAARYRGLRCGMNVEILGSGRLLYGRNVSLGQGTRVELADDARVEFGDEISISRHVHIAPESGRCISVGNGTTIQDGCRIYGDVAIGRQCIFAPNVFVSSGTHVFDKIPHRSIQEQESLAPFSSRSIRIFSDCWFGINAVILQGVTVGRGCVVGANTVVNRDLPPYTVAAGCPAKVVKQRLNFSPKAKITATTETDWPYFYDGFDLRLSENENSFVARPKFILAMHRPDAKAIRLSVSGHDGELAYRNIRRSICAQTTIVEFGLELPQQGPLFEFDVSGYCRVHEAELV